LTSVNPCPKDHAEVAARQGAASREKTVMVQFHSTKDFASLPPVKVLNFADNLAEKATGGKKSSGFALAVDAAKKLDARNASRDGIAGGGGSGSVSGGNTPRAGGGTPRAGGGTPKPTPEKLPRDRSDRERERDHSGHSKANGASGAAAAAGAIAERPVAAGDRGNPDKPKKAAATAATAAATAVTAAAAAAATAAAAAAATAEAEAFGKKDARYHGVWESATEGGRWEARLKDAARDTHKHLGVFSSPEVGARIYPHCSPRHPLLF